MERPDWYYDDLKQVGTDFADAGEVATYDKRQNDDRTKDRVLLAKLGLKTTDMLADWAAAPASSRARRLSCAAPSTPSTFPGSCSLPPGAAPMRQDLPMS